MWMCCALNGCWRSVIATAIARWPPVIAAWRGWLPSYTSFDRSSIELVEEAERAGLDPAEFVVDELKAGRLNFACEDRDAHPPAHWPV